MLEGIFVTSEWLQWCSRRENISPTALQVFTVYLRYMNTDTGKAFPAYSTIMQTVGISNKTVAVALEELQKLELLRFTRYRKGHNKEYRIKNYDTRLKKLRRPGYYE